MTSEKLTLRRLIEAVEDNNRINDGAWTNWSDADAIVDIYDPAGVCAGNAWDRFEDEDVTAEQASEILNRAIASNGASLADDLEALAVAVWGEGVGCWYSDHAARYRD